MGSSLGWMIQLDGDTRRNEFINSPWVRVCLPILPGREREAIAWLARHIEGEVGYDVNSGVLKEMLEKIEEIHAHKQALGINGPDYVTIDSKAEDDHREPNEPLKPQHVYPIVDDFS